MYKLSDVGDCVVKKPVIKVISSCEPCRPIRHEDGVTDAHLAVGTINEFKFHPKRGFVELAMVEDINGSYCVRISQEGGIFYKGIDDDSLVEYDKIADLSITEEAIDAFGNRVICYYTDQND